MPSVTQRGCRTTLQHVSVEVEPEKIAACVAFYDVGAAAGARLMRAPGRR